MKCSVCGNESVWDDLCPHCRKSGLRWRVATVALLVVFWACVLFVVWLS